VLKRDGSFEPLIDVMEFDGRLVVLDGHTRHQAYVRHFETVNLQRLVDGKKNC